MTDRIYFTQFKIDLTGAEDMLLKREILVEGDAQVADSSRKMNRGSIQINRERERQAFLVVFRSDEIHLSLIRIRLKFTVVHSCLNIRYARL